MNAPDRRGNRPDPPPMHSRAGTPAWMTGLVIVTIILAMLALGIVLLHGKV